MDSVLQSFSLIKKKDGLEKIKTKKNAPNWSPRRLRAKYTHCTNLAVYVNEYFASQGRLAGRVSARARENANRNERGKCMGRNVYVHMTKLHNVKGRITYIISYAKQENLYAVYETCERPFWRKLAAENQKDFLKSGTSGTCIEAREFIIALPENFTKYNPNELLREYTEFFKENYGVECIAALHHNKAKTNYHIHLIFSERKLLEKPIRKIATRNMFYDENGKHVRTKKEILEENGVLKPGCKIIPKGEVYEEKLFEKKQPKFKEKNFNDEVKHLFAEKMNERMADASYKMTVFNKEGPYLPTKKIGKNNPKEHFIRQNNAARIKWNTTVSKALWFEVPAKFLIAVKEIEITNPMKSLTTATPDKGTALDALTGIISRAVKTLGKFVDRVLMYHLEDSMKPHDELFMRVLGDSRKAANKNREMEWER